MASLVKVPVMTIEDCALRYHGWLNPQNDILEMDRRRLARELRRVVRKSRRNLTRKRPYIVGTAQQRAEWWVMLRQTCRKYGVRA